MSDAPESDQKTETPTPKRLADAARDGDILQSKELGTALVMLAGAAWFAVAGPWFFGASRELVRAGLTIDRTSFEHFDPAMNAVSLTDGMTGPLASLFAVTIIAAIAGPALLGSIGFRTKAMAPKPSRLNPGAGLKRMFGMHGLIELGKSMAKAGALGVAGYWLIASSLPLMMGLSAGDIEPALSAIGSTTASGLIVLSLCLLLIAGIDVPIQWIRRNMRLKMSKQEIREEAKQSDGSPEVKQAQRRRQREVLQGSARAAVSGATVILTNPTHFAIALRYRPGIDAAPMVVARGRGETALAIRALAKDEGIPTLDYPQLTRALYFTTRAGHVIAEDLYIAVATILAFVFNLERALADGVTQPFVDVPEARQFDEHGVVSPA
jgi:flagellar biosynthesis protein FlhB